MLVAFASLVKHQPKYANDLVDLTSSVRSEFEHVFVAWERRLAELKEYKATVFDSDTENDGNAFFVSSTTNALLHRWYAQQVKLFSDHNWRSNDDHIISTLQWSGDSVDEVRKCILDQRQQKLLAMGAVLDTHATRKREGRADALFKARRKRVNKTLA